MTKVTLDISFNINDNVRVKLTSRGKAILSKHVTDTIADMPNLSLPDGYTPYREGSDGYLEIQLWQFMSIFGSHIYNGAPPVVENNIIEFRVGE